MNELDKALPEQENATPTPETPEVSAEQKTEVKPTEPAEPAEAPTEAAEAPAEFAEAPAKPAVSDEDAAVPVSDESKQSTQSEQSESPKEEDPEKEDAPEPAEKPQPKFHEMGKEELLATLRGICSDKQSNMHKEVAAIKAAFYNIRKQEMDQECADFVEAGNDPATFSSMPDPAENEFKDLLASFKQMRTEYLEAEELRLQANLDARNKILAELNEIASDIDNINMHFPKFQQLQADFRAITEIPAGAVNDSWKAYQQVAELFYDRLKMNKELRDLDFKKNLEAKTLLIEQAKALAEVQDVIAAFKKLQALHDRWRELGPVARELRESLWDEFKEASTVINKRHQEYFETRKAEEKANEEAKIALCEEIEAIDLECIKTFAAWNEHTKVIIGLQERWKQLGFASRKVNNELFARFRKSCDDFFTRKSEYFKQTKAELAGNLERKIALCEKAEALKENPEGKNPLEEVVKLQAEWKTIGSVPRKQSDAVWERFSTACNFFFDAQKKARAEQRREETANLAAKREVIAKIKAIEPGTSSEDAGARVRELQNEWAAIGHVPYKQKDKLYDDYRAAVDEAYQTFDIRRTRARMARFENEVKEMEGDSGKMRSEREKLQRVLDAKRNDLATYENNLGFFNVKSKDGSGLVKEMERKMARLREEIEEVQSKIKLLRENKD